MTPALDPASYRYRAFISYSHRDRAWADWLHRALEGYRVPRRLVGRTTAAGPVPRRLTPVFRDRDELASATDLGRKVDQALRESANLIVICSPQAARSRWVEQEIRAFRRLGRGERVFCLIVGGEPHAGSGSPRPGEECFAPSLRHPLQADGSLGEALVEPIAADVRPGKDGKENAKLKLIAGMLDLGFDELKQRELRRRNRRLTAVTATAVAIMLLTSLLAIDALVARRTAERRQQQAESLVEFMLGDLNDKLAQVQRLDVMEAVDDKALAYFQSLPDGDVTEQSSAQRARALEKIGSVRLDQSRLTTAMSAFQAAARLSGPLADAAPQDVDRQVAYARVLAFIGMTHWYRGELDAAQRRFEQAQAVLQRAGPDAAGHTALVFELSSLDNNIGHVLEARGRLDEAAVHYRRMLARCRTLAAIKPARAEWLEHLGEAHNNLGKLALMRGDLVSAVAEYSADDAIETALSASDPDDNGQRENMARVRAILGRTLAMTAEVARGTRQLQEALDTAGQLSRFNPGQPGLQEKVALYSLQLARLRRLAGEPRAAAALTARALDMLGQLARRDPSNTGWQQALAEAHVEQAAQMTARGRPAAARARLQQALKLLAPLLTRQPDERTLLLATARARLQLAGSGIAAEHAQALRATTLQASRSVRSGQLDLRLRAVQVEALLGLHHKGEASVMVRALWAAGYRDPEFLVLLREAAIDYPPNPAFQQRLLARLASGP